MIELYLPLILLALLVSVNVPRWYHFMRGDGCSRCAGRGEVIEEVHPMGADWGICPKCNGRGWLKKEKK